MNEDHFATLLRENGEYRDQVGVLNTTVCEQRDQLMELRTQVAHQETLLKNLRDTRRTAIVAATLQGWLAMSGISGQKAEDMAKHIVQLADIVCAEMEKHNVT